MPTTRRSLRHSIADDLRRQIVTGGLAPGERLPSEPALARTLGVSRSSVRAAITLLEEDGLVQRRHGSGTYVTHRPLMRNDLSHNFSVSSMIAAMGREPGATEERCGTEPAPAVVAGSLGIEPGAPVSALHRVRTADGRPVVDATDWCHPDVLSPAQMRGLGEGSVYAALAELGISVHHGVASITPDVATGDIADRLGVARGALLLTLFQVDSTADGRVVLVSQEHHLADAFEVTVYRRGPGAGAGEQR
jgi:GntR family transcriptional regulator